VIDLCDRLRLELEVTEPATAVPAAAATPLEDYAETTGAINNPDGWQLWRPFRGSIQSAAQPWGHEGRVWLFTADGGADAQVESDPRSRRGLRPGRVAELGVTVAGDAGRVRLHLTYRNAAGDVIKTSFNEQDVPSTGEPRRLWMRSVIPEGADRVRPWLRLLAPDGSDAAAGQKVMFDSVTLVADDEPLEPPSGYTPYDLSSVFVGENLIANPDGVGGPWGWHPGQNATVSATSSLRLHPLVPGTTQLHCYTHVPQLHMFNRSRVDMRAPDGKTLWVRLGIQVVEGGFGSSVWDAQVVMSHYTDWTPVGDEWTTLHANNGATIDQPNRYYRYTIWLRKNADATATLQLNDILFFRNVRFRGFSNGDDNHPFGSANTQRGGLLVGHRLWRDLLSDASSVEVHREELNVGTLSAVVPGAAWDPSVNDQARPSRAVRLSARTLPNQWEPLFTGTTDRIDVTYQADGTRLVTLEAVDAVARLAQLPQRFGVSRIDDLPQVLTHYHGAYQIDGADVFQTRPFTDAVWSANNDATALDQVVIARDTESGYAWVDRAGVLQLFHADQMPDVPVVEFSDQHDDDDPAHQCYLPGDDLAHLHTDDVINELTVRQLLYDPATDETVEHVHLFRNGTSAAKWGTQRHEITIAALDAADVENLAQAILDDNAEPRVRPSLVRFPVRSDDELRRAATLDLMQLVRVRYTPAGLDTTVRIAGVKHTIDAANRRWLVEVDLRSEHGVAQQRSVPPVRSRNLPPYVMGRTTQTADASGFVTVTAASTPDGYNPGFTPRVVVVVPEAPIGGGPVFTSVTVDQITSTSFRFRGFYNNDSTIAGNEVTFRWIAYR